MSRTLRNGSHRYISAAVGTGVLLAGFLFLQYGQSSESSAEAASASQSAVAERGADGAATRGAQRSSVVVDLAEQVANAAADPNTLVVNGVDVNMLTTTTTLPPTTLPTTTVPPATRPSTTRPPAPAPAPSAAGDDAVWSRLAKCESGGNPKSVSSNGKYHGAFQFSLGTWRSLGAPGVPTDHSYEVQLQYAKQLQARSGWGQWPHCSHVALRG